MRLTIRNKLIAGFGVIVVLMLLCTAIVSQRLSVNAASLEHIKDVRYHASLSAAFARSSILGAAAALRGYVLFGSNPDDGAKFKQERANHWQAADAAIARLQALSQNLTPAEKAQIDDLVAQAAEFRSLQDKVESLAFGHGTDATGQAFDILKINSAPRVRKLSESLRALMEEHKEQTDHEIAALTASGQSTQQLEWVVTFIAALAAMALAFFISRRFDVALGPVVARASSIASGDLTGELLAVPPGDELGDPDACD